MKTLLVTGGSGFIGSNFIRYLLTETGFSGRVINVDKLTYAGNPENLQDISDRFKDRYVFEKADICNLPDMERIFRAHGVDSVCHFAAESHVDRSIASPEIFIETNVKGTFNLLEASRKLGDDLVLFHHVSTDEVYGSLGRTGYFTELTPYAPRSPYSASKAASDHLVRAYASTYGLRVTLSNCSNNYGPYQFPEKLIPLMILNALDGKPLPVYGDGSNIRDWLFVRDHCRAIWMIMTQGRCGETYAVGGECERSNLTLVETLCSIVDGLKPSGTPLSRDRITFVKDRPGHDFRYAIDCTKLKTELGWAPQETFETGLVKTVSWYLDHREWTRRIMTGEYLNWIQTQYHH